MAAAGPDGKVARLMRDCVCPLRGQNCLSNVPHIFSCAKAKIKEEIVPSLPLPILAPPALLRWWGLGGLSLPAEQSPLSLREG
jgi:hypothetical protein